jgi:hypothetical protein
VSRLNHLNAPPRIATWLLSMFGSDQEIEPIEGDLREEFEDIVSRSGRTAARSWYWKQAFKTAMHMAGNTYRSKPILIIATVIGGVFLVRQAENISTWAICGVLDGIPGFYEAHFQAWQFCVNDGIAVGTLLLSMLAGCLIGWLWKDREIITTVTLSASQLVVFPALTFAWAAHAAHPSPYIRPTVSEIFHMAGLSGVALLFVLPFSSLVMPVIGGGIVRRLRRHRLANG